MKIPDRKDGNHRRRQHDSPHHPAHHRPGGGVQDRHHQRRSGEGAQDGKAHPIPGENRPLVIVVGELRQQRRVGDVYQRVGGVQQGVDQGVVEEEAHLVLHGDRGEELDHEEKGEDRPDEDIRSSSAEAALGSIGVVAGDRVGDRIPHFSDHHCGSAQGGIKADDIGEIEEKIETDNREEKVAPQVTDAKTKLYSPCKHSPSSARYHPV